DTVTATDSSSTPASDTQTITITITGTNDAPNIFVGTGDSAAATLAETNAILSTSGTLTVTDADIADTVSLSSSATAVTTSGPLGTLTTGQLQAMLSLTASSLTALPADPTNTSNLTWTFNSGGGTTFVYMAEGASLVLNYTVNATYSRTPTPGSDTPN